MAFSSRKATLHDDAMARCESRGICSDIAIQNGQDQNWQRRPNSHGRFRLLRNLNECRIKSRAGTDVGEPLAG